MSKEKFEDQPYMEEYMRGLAGAIAGILDEDFEEKMGFFLLLWPYGDGGESRANYLSNVQRESAIKALKETVIRLESQLDAPPGTKSGIRDN